MSKPKNKKPIKVRKTWTINPRERIREDEKKEDVCSKCGSFRLSPEICMECEYA